MFFLPLRSFPQTFNSYYVFLKKARSVFRKNIKTLNSLQVYFDDWVSWTKILGEAVVFLGNNGKINSLFSSCSKTYFVHE